MLSVHDIVTLYNTGSRHLALDFFVGALTEIVKDGNIVPMGFLLEDFDPNEDPLELILQLLSFTHPFREVLPLRRDYLQALDRIPFETSLIPYPEE